MLQSSQRFHASSFRFQFQSFFLCSGLWTLTLDSGPGHYTIQHVLCVHEALSIHKPIFEFEMFQLSPLVNQWFDYHLAQSPLEVSLQTARAPFRDGRVQDGDAEVQPLRQKVFPTTIVSVTNA